MFCNTPSFGMGIPDDLPKDIKRKIRNEMVTTISKQIVVDYVYNKRRNPSIELEGYIENWIKTNVRSAEYLDLDILNRVMDMMTAMSAKTRRRRQ